MYPTEVLDENEDDGTMVDSLDLFANTVVGHRIVGAEWSDNVSEYNYDGRSLCIELDDGRKVHLDSTSSCCAYTEVEEFLLHANQIDHIITGVGTTKGYTTWHVFADFGDVMEMRVGWSCGNPFYYSYGFDIRVSNA